jgi:hypothetical protein
MLHCSTLNGVIFLGSIAWWQYALQPAIQWAAAGGIIPVAGQQAGLHLELGLHLVYQVLWLAPAYIVTLLVSAAWYTEMAGMAVQVRPRYDARVLAAQLEQQLSKQRSPDHSKTGEYGIISSVTAVSHVHGEQNNALVYCMSPGQQQVDDKFPCTHVKCLSGPLLMPPTLHT